MTCFKNIAQARTEEELEGADKEHNCVKSAFKGSSGKVC